MPQTDLRPCAYHVIRYIPNLVRDEWINIGILLFDPETGRGEIEIWVPVTEK